MKLPEDETRRRFEERMNLNLAVQRLREKSDAIKRLPETNLRRHHPFG